MPGKYPSSLCPRCEGKNGSGSVETTLHRYSQCVLLSKAWDWLKNCLILLDPSLSLYSDWELLFFDFEKGMRENAILWLLGIFIETVDNLVVIKENSLSSSTLVGILLVVPAIAKLSSSHQLPFMGHVRVT